MPRYVYQCSECETKQIVFLRISETITDCENSNSKNTMIKVYDKFFSNIKSDKEQKIGNITNEYIEKNREILNQQKKEAKSTEYEPS